MFDREGNPLLNAAGEPLTLSYTHAAAYVGAEIARSGSEPKTTNDVAGLNIPFWQPTDVIVFSNDGHVIIGMRSNATKNAIGRCLTAAAGFPQVVSGAPEDALICGKRELLEETGLQWEKIAAKTVDLGLITNRPLQQYKIKTTTDGVTLPGIVPTIVRTFAVKAKQDRNELLQMMRINHEALGYAAMQMTGFVGVSFEDFCACAQTPGKQVDAKFAPSTALPVTVVQDSALADLRAIYENPETAKIAPNKDGYMLNGLVNVKITSDDFIHNGSREALEKTILAAQQLDLMAARPAIKATTTQTLNLNR